ncbi:hypothetical protein ABIA35_008811 [Catenulispora sp. MAP12-49]|uniref:hypothetical protein n=1 Tax=unclassified Catenulispora TaxID=414885 RepID=UPI0035135DA5
MLVTNHVLSGAVIGAAVRRPLPALAIGVASHFALDAVPHWGDWESKQHFMRVAVADGLIGLAAMGVITRAAMRTPANGRAKLAVSVVLGMAGAALPDLDKPAHIIFQRKLWPDVVNRFHSRIQDEAPGRFVSHELVAATGFALSAAALLRRRAASR